MTPAEVLDLVQSAKAQARIEALHEVRLNVQLLATTTLQAAAAAPVLHLLERMVIDEALEQVCAYEGAP